MDKLGKLLNKLIKQIHIPFGALFLTVISVLNVNLLHILNKLYCKKTYVVLFTL